MKERYILVTVMNEPIFFSSALVFLSLVCIKVVHDGLNHLADHIVAQRQFKVIAEQKPV